MQLPNGYIWESIEELPTDLTWVSSTNSLHVWEEFLQSQDGTYYKQQGCASFDDVSIWKGVECD